MGAAAIPQPAGRLLLWSTLARRADRHHPYLPYVGLVGFLPLPGMPLITVSAIIALYVVPAEMTKCPFLSRCPVTRAARRCRGAPLSRQPAGSIVPSRRYEERLSNFPMACRKFRGCSGKPARNARLGSRAGWDSSCITRGNRRDG